MELLDEQGRLFGRVNVVDALVIVFAIAVVVAGAALVFADEPEPDQPEEPDGATMNVTFGTASYGATAFEPGRAAMENRDVNITDVHVTTGPRAYVRVALDGVVREGRFRFSGDPVRLGERYTLLTNTSRADVTLEQRDVSRTFETETTTVTVETIVRPQIAEAVSAGDEHRIANSTVARVTGADSRPAEDPDVDDGRTLTVTLELETRTVEGVPHYGGRPVQLGRTIEFESDEYLIEAEVVGRG